jgi:GNAT superfamily N-acetyltransferase
MSFEIREATDLDIPDVLLLYAQPSFDDGKILSVLDARDIFKTFQNYPFYKLFVVMDTSKESKIVASYALLKMNNIGHLGSPSAIVEDVVVASEYQNQGIGRQMMHHAMQMARSLGCYKLVLSSNLKRAHAHAFYKSLDFEQHGLSFRVNL